MGGNQNFVGASLLGVSQVGAMSKFFAIGGNFPYPPSRENHVIVSTMLPCYSIDKFNGSLKIFPKFSLSAMIFQELLLNFSGVPWFFKFYKIFTDSPGSYCVLWTLLSLARCIVQIITD